MTLAASHALPWIDSAADADRLRDPSMGRAAALLLLRDNDRFALSVSRKTSGLIGLPSGKLDPGETPLAGCLREVEEETGLRIAPEIASWLGAAICEPEHEGGRFFWVDAFVVRWNGSMGEPRQMEPQVLPAWVAPDELVSRGAFAAYNAAVLRAWRAKHQKA